MFHSYSTSIGVILTLFIIFVARCSLGISEGLLLLFWDISTDYCRWCVEVYICVWI